MPAKGQSQTEATKKKISEALTKNGGVEDEIKVVRSKEAQDIFNDYTASVNVTESLRTQREALKAKIKAMGRKKTAKSTKDKVKKKLEAVRAKMREEKAKRAGLRSKALQMKRVKVAKAYIERSKINGQRLDAADVRAQAFLAKATKPESKKRIQEILNRIKQNREKYKINIEKANAVVSSGGKSVKKETSDIFNFSEHLMLMPFSPYRILTAQEKRCDLEFLNEQFNELQTGMEDELKRMTDEEIDKFLQTAEKKINAGDIAALAILGLMIRGKLKKAIDEKLIAAYEAGKKTAVNEINKSAKSDESGGIKPIERPATPLDQTQIKNLDVNDIADGYISEIEQTARGHIKDALAVGAATAAIISTTRDRMKKTSDRMAANIAGTLIGQYVNRGRKQVFAQNIKRISKFQRSEVLDNRTCAMCESIDELVVTADDPMAQMDLVHSHCRGVWIPIFVIDEEQPDVTGIPTTIMDNFDLVDGRPVVNSFRQLKKPAK